MPADFTVDSPPRNARVYRFRPRERTVRLIALVCACCLSVGSHYGSYLLGPLKSRLSRELGTSNTQFSLLISAFGLSATWTPFVGGLLASRLGTTLTSILATGVILLGQLFLLLGELTGNIPLMAFGMFIFGLGVSPLAVVQESIIVRFFQSHGLGLSMAFGLIVGKASSFVSARSSFALTEKFGTSAPFVVATVLAGVSVVVNIIYILMSSWLVEATGAELEAPDIQNDANHATTLSEAQALKKVAEKRVVHLRDIGRLGDVFWAYVSINILCGTLWYPFIHLGSNIIEQRYEMTEKAAANEASYMLAGSIFLYPLCGYLIDRVKSTSVILKLFFISSFLQLFAYIWLALPPHISRFSFPGIISFGAAYGMAPLLLVVLVPRIVPSKYVSTALGLHKSVEQVGSTIFLTLAGLGLDIHTGHSNISDIHTEEPNDESRQSIQTLLNVWVLFCIFHLFGVFGLWYLQRCRAVVAQPGPSSVSHSEDSEGERRPLLQPQHISAIEDVRIGGREARRGKILAGIVAFTILFAWILFLVTAWFRLGERLGSSVMALSASFEA